MHELTEKVYTAPGTMVEADKIITDWLKEKADIIENSWCPYVTERIEHNDINQILGIAEESLEYKFEKYFIEEHPFDNYEGLIKIAKQHFKEHPEELRNERDG